MTTAAPPARLMVRSLPAAIRVRELRLTLDDQEIIRRARITPSAMRRAAAGEPIGWDVEKRILALPVPAAHLLDEWLDAIGCQRRLRALVAMGWPPANLAAALRWKPADLRQLSDQEQTTRRVHIAVCALYDQLWDQRPEEHGVPYAVARELRSKAREAKYAGPLAWDDDTIDRRSACSIRGSRKNLGPADEVEIMRALEGDTSVRLAKVHTRVAVEYGARRRDMDFATIAHALRMKEDTVGRSWERIKRDARAAGQTWPDEPRWTDEGWIRAAEARSHALEAA